MHPLTAEVDKELYLRVKAAAQKHEIKLRQVIEWGLEAFLQSAQTPEAKSR